MASLFAIQGAEELVSGLDQRRLGQVPFDRRGDPARDRQEMLESLRRALPGAGLADVRVDGRSWRPEEGKEGPSSP